jgi:putative ABC transport system substrate-binding protein
LVPSGQALATSWLQELDALGWRDGRNLEIEWRWAGGDDALYQRYAEELVTLGPELVVAVGTPSVEALRQQSRVIPIVFALITDPVGQGFVESLARPGGSITGFSNYEPAMAGKWLGMLTQIMPPVARVSVLYNPATAPFADTVLRAIQEAALSGAPTVRAAACRDDAEVEAMMTRVAREDRGGVLVLSEPFTLVHRDAIIASAARHRLPAVYADRRYTAAGGLMSYGVDPVDLFRRSADYVDRILKGSKPADLPVQNPTKFELVINLKTAKTLGLDIPDKLLAVADEVIE